MTNLEARYELIVSQIRELLNQPGYDRAELEKLMADARQLKELMTMIHDI